MIRTQLQRCLCAAILASALAASAQSASDKGVAWTALTPAQQQVLAPLQRDWQSIDVNRRQKWLEVARRFDSMPPDERNRVQERMVEWARLTPAERTQARLQFQEARQLPAQERNAKWQAYQALPESERRTLAQRAQPSARPASASESASRPRPGSGESAALKRPPAAASGVATLPTSPIVVQARPGATTTTMTTRPAARAMPPQGAPKIAATASFVNPATLLPKRSAAVPAASSPADSSPQQ